MLPVMLIRLEKEVPLAKETSRTGKDVETPTKQQVKQGVTHQ